ncbi:MAG: hypothetical protein K940chlam3_00852 [Chlamydiae bacterium]|nr:hypothetical protein [Chlamydiota bacterium]
MQPFDPKLYDNQNSPERKPPRVSTDRAVDKPGEADEGRRGKAKKFKLDDGEKSKKREGKTEKKEEKELPSAFSLATTAPKKKIGEKREDEKPADDVAEEELLEKEKKSKQSVQAREKSDLAQPQMQDQMKASALMGAEQTGSVAKTSKAQMDLLMKLLVDSVTQMKTDGKTETTVVLKHPPLFAGAKLTLTAFDTAKGEFNVTFSELTAQAKQLLDMQQAKESLMRHLEEKGYVLHIMVTTTEKEETLLTAEAEKFEREREEEREREGEREKREQEDQ